MKKMEESNMMTEIQAEGGAMQLAGARSLVRQAEMEAPLQVVIQAYLDYLEGRVMRSSVRTYGRSLRAFARWITEAGKDTYTMTSKDIAEFDCSNAEAGMTIQTRKLYMSAVKGLYEWAEGVGGARNIARPVRIRNRGEVRFVKQHLEDSQVKALLKAAARQGLRDWAIVNLIVRTGLRTIEVTRINLCDSSLTPNGVRVLKIQGKGHTDKDRIVVLTQKAWLPIRQYIHECRAGARQGEPLFVGESNANRGGRLHTGAIAELCQKALRSIGLEGHEYSAHSLRHTFAVAALQHGAPIDRVQETLGHHSIDTTKIYLKSIADRRRLQSPAEAVIDNAY